MKRHKRALGETRTPLPKQFVGYKKCERWTDTTKLCVEGKKYGFSVTLKAGRQSLPVSAGDPRTPAEAFDNAKKWLTTKIYGKNN